MSKNYSKIPYLQIRGGSSKGIYFNKQDLPTDIELRDKILLSVIGGEASQIDGLGGANPLTSKVAIVNKAQDNNYDIDFLFAQIVVGEHRVDTSPNCGNILAGVAIFAIATGLITTTAPTTLIKIKMINSGANCELIMATPNGKLQISGNTKIDGVLATSAPIICNYLNIAGSTCGSLFPTGTKTNIIDGISITCIDNGMPVILIPAAELGKTGYESCEELSNDDEFKLALENIRIKAAPIMNIKDATNKVIPKMAIISTAKNGGNINTRTFIPHKCHSAIGVLGAVSVASACLYDDCVTNNIYDVIETDDEINKTVVVEHPSGNFTVQFSCEKFADNLVIKSAGIIRTARLISKGEVYPHP